MLQKLTATVLALSFFISGFSQATDSTKVVAVDSTKKTSPPVTITGSVDAYYRYNFDNPKEYPYNSPTSFTHSSNSFELGMASIRADHSFGKVSATVDLGFGTRAEEFAYNDAATRLAIKQLYVSYAPNATFKFTMGTWGTHIGYEVLDAYLNRNYSMSYMFTNGPFSHTGLKADVSLGGKSAFMVGISNAIDHRTDPAGPKNFIAQFSTGSKDDKLKAYLNFVTGSQTDTTKKTQVDLVATYALSSKFGLGLNVTYQSASLQAYNTTSYTAQNWEGFALYINYDPSSTFGLTLRSEYIDDGDQFLGLKSALAETLSGNFRIDNLTIIPEIRLDNTGEFRIL